MTHERFNELLAGPLRHPIPVFTISRLVLALKAVVDATGDAGEKALEEYCAAREREDAGEPVDGPAEISILPTDRIFDNSPDVGHPDCLCSRCGQLIREEELSIRCIREPGKEYRFHPRCVGLEEDPHYEIPSEPEELP